MDASRPPTDQPAPVGPLQDDRAAEGAVASTTIDEAYAVTDAAEAEAIADRIAMGSTTGLEAVVGRWRTPVGRLLRTAMAFLAIGLLVATIWEGFKWLAGDPWRLTGILGTGIDYFHDPPFALLQASDRQLPHLWDIVAEFAQPFQRSATVTLGSFLLEQALYTWQEAIVGFLLGAAIGVVLASLFVHWSVMERAFVPWVVASQTVPIVALAPLIVVTIGRGTTAVVFIATYLTFFPVTIAMTRGLRASDPRALELLRSYAASRWQVYRKVRLPGSTPYLFTALKVAAAASVVGAIIGEGPGGVPRGLGTAISTFNQQYITGPERLWAAIIVAGAVGIAFFMLVRVAEVLVVRGREVGS
jgi:NitT/TauT family transport system permease protein